jgi:hypothetical protein
MGEGEGLEAATPKCQDRLPAWARLDAWGTPKNGIVGRELKGNRDRRWEQSKLGIFDM